MKANILSQPIDKMLSGTLVLTVFKDEKPLKGANGLVDWRLCGKLSKLVMDKKITGEYKENTLIISQKSMIAPRILVVGLGEGKDFNESRLEEVSLYIADTLKNVGVKKVSLSIPGSSYLPQNYAKSAEIVLTAFSKSYDKKSSLLEMLIFETGRRIAMVCEGANGAKSILKNKLVLTTDI